MTPISPPAGGKIDVSASSNQEIEGKIEEHFYPTVEIGNIRRSMGEEEILFEMGSLVSECSLAPSSDDEDSFAGEDEENPQLDEQANVGARVSETERGARDHAKTQAQDSIITEWSDCEEEDGKGVTQGADNQETKDVTQRTSIASSNADEGLDWSEDLEANYNQQKADYPDSSEEWNLSSKFRRSRSRPRRFNETELSSSSTISQAFSLSALASSIWSEDLEEQMKHPRPVPALSYSGRSSTSRRYLSRAEEFDLAAAEEENKQQQRFHRLMVLCMILLLVVGVAGALLLYYFTDVGKSGR